MSSIWHCWKSFKGLLHTGDFLPIHFTAHCLQLWSPRQWPRRKTMPCQYTVPKHHHMFHVCDCATKKYGNLGKIGFSASCKNTVTGSFAHPLALPPLACSAVYSACNTTYWAAHYASAHHVSADRASAQCTLCQCIICQLHTMPVQHYWAAHCASANYASAAYARACDRETNRPQLVADKQ